MNTLASTISAIQDVLAICPCCGELFRLVEGKLVLASSSISKGNPYSELMTLERNALIAEERLSTQEDRFDQKFKQQRETILTKARSKAKRKLRKIDPVFTGRKIDAQDVKVLFDPVEYVIFKGLSDSNLHQIRLVSREPVNKRQEVITKSIEKTIKAGNVGFETLRLADNGRFERS